MEYITCRSHTAVVAGTSCEVFIFRITELVTRKTLNIKKRYLHHTNRCWGLVVNSEAVSVSVLTGVVFVPHNPLNASHILQY
jgi:hypothetical protein